ncbi:MAG TPA: hypothetical protein VFF79_10010 [Conexibacter sp.]|jgi:hypothetical protein|nr:hypothetical protein [Conexibacter sp.]
MPPSRRLRAPAGLALALALLLVVVAPAAADNVVADNQIVQGNLCVGLSCANGESFSSRLMRVKVSDTPGINLVQTGGGFGDYTWDVAGNEANFFVRDVTGGNHLPFRIRPGAPTSSLEIAATGDVSTLGILSQSVTPGALTLSAEPNGPALLAALRTLPISRYTINADTTSAGHLAPAGADFRAAFGLGARDSLIAPADMAAVALAAVKALDARVTAIGLTPGPQGAPGPQGTTGASGPAGVAADLTAANRRISALQRSNRRLASSVRTLQRQVRALLARR